MFNVEQAKLVQEPFTFTHNPDIYLLTNVAADKLFSLRQVYNSLYMYDISNCN